MRTAPASEIDPSGAFERAYAEAAGVPVDALPRPKGNAMTAVKTRTIITRVHSVEAALRTPPMHSDTSRGLYYRYDCDEAAMIEARSKEPQMATALRSKVKDPEAAVNLSIELRDGKLFTVASITEREILP